MRISLVIPAYNIESYIEEAVESALAQEPGFFEVVIINDGSTDGTLETIQLFIKNRPGYNVSIYNQENRGLSATRNFGISIAKGDYIYFMDGDDKLHPDMTKKILGIHDKYSVQLDAIFFSAVDFDDKNKKILASSVYYQRAVQGYYSTGKEVLLLSLKSKKFPVPVQLGVYRLKLLTDCAHLKFKDQIHEDEVFTPNLLMACRNVFVLQEVLYYRRVRPGSIMTSGACRGKVKGLLLASKNWRKLQLTSEDEARDHYHYKASEMYNRANLAASRAGMSRQSFNELVLDIVPEFSKYVLFDYFISRISRKLAWKISVFRMRFIKSR